MSTTSGQVEWPLRETCGAAYREGRRKLPEVNIGEIPTLLCQTTEQLGPRPPSAAKAADEDVRGPNGITAS